MRLRRTAPAAQDPEKDLAAASTPEPAGAGHTRRRTLAAAGAAAAGLMVPAAARASATGPLIVVDESGGGDYTSIEDAVTNAPADSTIEVRPGTYPVTKGHMNPAAGITIRGAGYASHIRAKDGLSANLFTIRSDRVTIDSLRIDGNGPNQTPRSSNCVYFDSADGQVVNCFVHDAAGYNIVGFPGATHWLISGNHSYTTGSNNVEFPRECIELQGTQFCAVVGNVVRGAGSNGILLWNSSGDCGYNTVAGNTVRGCAGAGIELEDGAHDNTITGNTCQGNNLGIWSNKNGNSAAPKYNTIIGNTVVASRGNGIYLENSVGTTVGDNVVRSSANYGIQLLNARDCSVTGNYVTRSNLSGIVLQDSSDIVCTSNVATENGQSTSDSHRRSGILVLQVSAGCANNVLSANRCHDAQSTPSQTYGIVLYNAVDNTVLSGNLLDGNGSSVLGLWVTSAATRTNSTPFRKLSVTVGNSPTPIAHGLGYTPVSMTIAMTSKGSIWKAQGSTGTYVWLQADTPNRTAELLLG
jgi:parallel beta-helix repeat protein